MIALFFEVLPRPGHEGTYLEIAAKLKPALDASGGLVFLDRSRSERRSGWFLSHQFWRDEASLARWRANPAHYRAQTCGRTEILADYRLRVGRVIAAYAAGQDAMQDHAARSSAYNDPGLTPERFVVSILTRRPLGGLGGETFASVYDAGLFVQVMDVATIEDGHGMLSRAASSADTLLARLCLLSRDYGMHDRREAPQFFEPIATTG